MDSSYDNATAQIATTQYLSYVISLWNETGSPEGWRCTVRNSINQKRLEFGSFEDMVLFLQSRLPNTTNDTL